jgi:hypothetical protein
MTTTLLSLLSPLICIGMMFGAGAAIRLATRTPLRRLSVFAHRADTGPIERGTRSPA